LVLALFSRYLLAAARVRGVHPGGELGRDKNPPPRVERLKRFPQFGHLAAAQEFLRKCCGTFNNLNVGPGGYCSPRHNMQFNARDEGSNALDDVASVSVRPYLNVVVRHVEDGAQRG